MAKNSKNPFEVDASATATTTTGEAAAAAAAAADATNGNSAGDVRIDMDNPENPEQSTSTTAAEGAEGGTNEAEGSEVAKGENEEEYIGGPKTFQQKAAAHNTMVTQYQVDEVIGIMRTNVEKILERDSKLSQLEQRADTLNETAEAFQKSAGSLKNKMWLENMKQTIYMIILGVVILFCVGKYLHLI